MSKVQIERELLSKPGDSILETIESLKMSQAELSERMGKTPSKISDIISGKEPITINTALQLEKVLGVDAKFWLNRELLYREKLSRIEQEEALEECLDWLKIQPLKELNKCGYLKSKSVNTETVEECLRFYGVASPNQWETLYLTHYFQTNFRKSKSHESELSSVAAWLRIGEIEMRKLQIKSYNKEDFKKNLTKIKKIVRNHPEDFATQLQQLCLDAGVALVYTMCISKAPINGATRWIGGTPLIQLTDRYKTNDHFWFTFFHEAGHVLLHGKKDVFIENLDGYAIDTSKENEANEFANKQLIPGDLDAELGEDFTIKSIKLAARKFETHPAIVLGRLQHLNKVPFSFGNDLKQSINLDDVVSKG